MRLLSLSTAEQGASLALFNDGVLDCHIYWASRLTHSVRLMAMVEDMLRVRAGVELSEMDGFIAARGPGSFTGLRIGISVVKGLAYGVSKPCAGVSSLDGIGYRFSQASQPVCVMMDAKRNEVYAAVYQFEGGLLKQKSRELVCPPEQAVSLAGDAALFVGSGSKAYQDLISSLTKNRAGFSCPTMDYVCAVALARQALMGEDFFENHKNELVPTYLRQSDAEIHLQKKAQLDM